MKVQFIKRPRKIITPQKKVQRTINEPAATLVAVRKDNRVYVGWSKLSLECDENQNKDIFDKNKGIELAQERASHVVEMKKLPIIVQRQMPKFLDSAKRYFKDCEQPIIH